MNDLIQLPALFWLGLAVLGALYAVPFVLYPAWVRWRAARAQVDASRPPVAGCRVRRVSVLIPAHNEAEVIAAKVRNTLALTTPEHVFMEVLVGADGCSDDTEAEAWAGADGDPRVVVYGHRERRGKPTTLNQLVSRALGDVLLVTDASASLAPDVLSTLVDELERSALVGVVGAGYDVSDGSGAPSEVAYWRRMREMKTAEARVGALGGIHGAAYAMRAEAWRPLPADTINDDVVVVLGARERGLTATYAPTALASDRPTTTFRAHYHRGARIASGNLTMLWRHAGLANPARPLGLHLLIAKGWKTVATTLPWVALAALTAGAVVGDAIAAALALIGWLMVALGAKAVHDGWHGIDRVSAGWRRSLGHALTAHLAYPAGLLRLLRGRQSVRWERVDGDQGSSSLAPSAPPATVRFVKRTLDIVGASLALLLLSPVMAAVAVAVRLGSPGPAIYRQVRMGVSAGGRERRFEMLKFRSMVVDAEASSGPVWATDEDPRITPVGRVLRKTRLDELPQLWNVLKGEMSLVGPRPERPSFCTSLDAEIPGYMDRMAEVKPGITGWAQIHCAYDTSVDSVREKLLYDLAYAAHLHDLRAYLTMELRCAWRTVAVMATGKGAR